MEPNDREYIARMAEKERQVRGLDEGDHVTVSARFGEFAGRVEEVKPADAGEGNYVVIIDAAVYNGQAQGADTHTVTIDYEGAFTSEYSYYVPYIVATADDVALHDVKELKIEKDAPKVRQ